MIDPRARVPFFLRPGLWLARRVTGKDPLPARLLAHAPKAAVGFGLFELFAAHAPGDLDGRTLAVARIVASRVAGCPFCVDMNAATWKSAGLSPSELTLLFDDDAFDDGARLASLGTRESIAAHYARALSRTPVVVDAALSSALTSTFTAREIVVLAAAIAQVNAWSRFNQGLGVPAAGFFDDSACPIPLPSSTVA